MNTCQSCYFYHDDGAPPDSGACWLEPPKILPLHTPQGVSIQMFYPILHSDAYCKHHDPRPRPTIKVVSMMPRNN